MRTSSRLILTLLTSSLSCVAAFGCSSTESASTPSDASTANDSATTGDGATNAEDAAADGSSSADAGADASTSAYKECTTAELMAQPVAAMGADVSFFNAGVDGGALAYVNNCVRIPVGKDVGWYGDFTMHPLENNGEPGTPIPNVSTGNDSGRITFSAAGKYSFHCTFHASTMYGTVLVQ